LLNIPYDSDKAIELAEELMEFIDYHGKERSMELAIEKGSFPNFTGSIYEKGNLKREKCKKDWKSLIKKIKTNGIRNATVSTIAPTGTISMICNTSSGIEPQFSLVFIKQVMDGEKLLYVNEIFEKTLSEDGLNNKDLLERISKEGGVAHIEEIPENIKKVYVTSHDISPEWHIKMQAAFQKYTDNAVSKTINFPNQATKEDIKIAFESAYRLSCKGVTVYRDGSRENQVLHVGNKTNEDKQPVSREVRAPRLRPEITSGMTQRLETGCGHLYVTINCDDLGPCEVFTQMGKVGGCASAQLEGIARLTSLALRASVKPESIIKQLKGIRCINPMLSKGKTISSCSDALAQSLETFLKVKQQGKLNGSIEVEPVLNPPQCQGKTGNLTCPECSGTVQHSEGCLKCYCGWSKC
jgi:ribonucleoside-diphosphate reductase alpha chain